MYLIAFPLLLIPLVLYHMVAFLLALPLDTTLFAVPVLAGERVAVNVGEALVMLGMLLLYVEFLKFTRHAAKAGMDHLLSLMLFAAMLFEFVSVPQAGTATFLLLIVLALSTWSAAFRSPRMRAATLRSNNRTRCQRPNELRVPVAPHIQQTDAGSEAASFAAA